ncbi:hypothetical protein RY831_04925 [Noviherbaspirillum sp. CPCC 100848]|uniref:Uncharacterized protein n=1 Tax=Noviherbaspirillum album TaxID=3080276 RepID=A0ABU6J4C4_9BURK|nr:hypothetical protein [Noviherbaspirillum sp. CPCC 100848]MEC4718478.1 hypothetical protein [Noviherbaspirillum sp. CPCC 100848]
MSTATFNSTQTVGLSYTENLSRAARAFLQALLAITPEAKPAAEEKRDVASIAQLYRMARSYDSIQPNLAQELRAIAARA